MTSTITMAEPDLQPPSADVRRRGGKATLALVALLLLAAALLIYRPWEHRPFDITDFSEFLPHLIGHDTALERFAAFVRYYFVDQGRANFLGYGALVAKWTVFGNDPVAWQLTRFALMLGIVAGAFALLSRLGASTMAAALAAALFIVANTATTAWTRLTMGEPMGLALVLVAAHVAAGYQGTARPRRDAAVIGLSLALALLAKEMLVACVPFVLLLVATRRPEGTFGTPRIDRRMMTLGVVVAIACAVALVPVALAALGASSRSFTAMYGPGSMSLSWYVSLVRRMLLTTPLLFPGNLGLMAIIGIGLLLALGDRGDRQPLLRAGLALSLPLVAAGVYLPWPKFEQFYGLPFLLGAALLLSTALGVIERRWGQGRWLAYAICLAALLYHAMNAVQQARESAVRQLVNAQVVSALATRAGPDTIFVAMPRRLSENQSWQGRGPTLRRHIVATHAGVSVPPAADVICTDAGRRYEEGLGRATLVTYSNQCGTLPRASLTIVERYRYPDWVELRMANDSLRVDLFFGDSR